MQNAQIIIITLVIVSTISILVMILRPWFKAKSSGVYITISEIIFMKLRGNPPNLLVEVAVLLKGSGIQFNYQDLEITYMAEKPNISGPNELIEKHKEIIRLREQSDRE